MKETLNVSAYATVYALSKIIEEMGIKDEKQKAKIMKSFTKHFKDLFKIYEELDKIINK